jgi:DnaJ family protein A protein 2
MGGIHGMGNRGKRVKPHPKIHEIPVCLHDFYHGKHLKLQFERNKFCSGCKGEGFSSFSSCGSCRGSGVVEQMTMIGPGMIATSRGPCTVCSGNGKTGTKSCDKCKGKKFFKEEKSLDIFIEPGMKAGDEIVFSNECSDDIQYKEPGDVHIVFQEADETIPMTRKGNDLFTSHTISFSESILGTSYILKNHPKYPNGFTINIPKGILNNETIIISNEGMPVKGRTKQFGSLHVKIEIQISQKEKNILQEKESELKSIFTSSD